MGDLIHGFVLHVRTWIDVSKRGYTLGCIVLMPANTLPSDHKDRGFFRRFFT